MKYYSNEDQEFIRFLILDDSQEKLGSRLVGQLFGVGRIALLLRKDDTSVLFVASNGNCMQIKEDKARLTSLLALLDYLEQQGYLYCLDYTGSEELLFCASHDPQIAVNETKTQYNYQGGYIKDINGKCDMYSPSNILVMNGLAISSPLAQKLRHFLAGEIYPAAQLSDLVENDFKSEEILQYEYQMKYARRSLRVSWGAFIVSILGMCLNVPISNSYGYSTINFRQFTIIDSIRTDVSQINSIISRMNLANMAKDTTSIVKGDCALDSCTLD